MNSPPSLRYGYHQDAGQRDYQEDDAGFQSVEGGPDDEICLAVLADGMGGHVGGREASRIAVKVFLEAFARHVDLGTEQRLLKALQASNQAIAATVELNSKMRGMGCTLIAAAATQDGVHWISVGDSPIWLWTGERLLRVNDDHSMAPALEAMVADGRMTQEEADRDPRRSALRSALTGDRIDLVDQSTVALQVEAGQRLILASDGLDTLLPDDLAHQLSNLSKDPSQLAVGLVKAVLDRHRSGQDNVSVAVLAPTDEPAQFLSSVPALDGATVTPLNRPTQPPLHRVGRSSWPLFTLFCGLGILIVLIVLWLILSLVGGEQAEEPILEFEPIATDLNEPSDLVEDTDSAPMNADRSLDAETPGDEASTSLDQSEETDDEEIEASEPSVSVDESEETIDVE